MSNLKEQILHIKQNIPLLEGKLEPICKEYQVDYEELLVEMLKFLNLIYESNQRLSPSLLVDLAWHEFILFTRNYFHFCETNYGRYIHHTPSAKEDPNAYRRTLQLYILKYQEPPATIWGHHAHEEWESGNCGSCHN